MSVGNILKHANVPPCNILSRFVCCCSIGSSKWTVPGVAAVTRSCCPSVVSSSSHNRGCGMSSGITPDLLLDIKVGTKYRVSGGEGEYITYTVEESWLET